MDLTPAEKKIIGRQKKSALLRAIDRYRVFFGTKGFIFLPVHYLNHLICENPLKEDLLHLENQGIGKGHIATLTGRP